MMGGCICVCGERVEKVCLCGGGCWAASPGSCPDLRKVCNDGWVYMCVRGEG